MKKKILLATFVGIISLLTLISGNAYAMLIMMDPGTIGAPANGDLNTLTGTFNELGLYVQTTSTITGANTFLDVGDLAVDALKPSNPLRDTEGLNTVPGWELTGRWSNLSGTFTNMGTYNLYNYQVGTIDFWGDPTPDADFGLTIGSDDDGVGGLGTTFTDGTKVATATLVSGTGHVWFDSNGVPVTGDTLTYWQLSYMLPNFWRDQYGNDLSPYVSSVPGFYIQATVDTNTHNFVVAPPKIHSDHDGSAGFGVIPEPTTMLLFGMGIVGLATRIRRKKAA